MLTGCGDRGERNVVEKQAQVTEEARIEREIQGVWKWESTGEYITFGNGKIDHINNQTGIYRVEGDNIIMDFGEGYSSRYIEEKIEIINRDRKRLTLWWAEYLTRQKEKNQTLHITRGKTFSGTFSVK